jgi:membrane-bound lytic murein transglycosylase C
MTAFSFWTLAALIASSLGVASVNTQAYMQVANGLEKAGLLGDKLGDKKALAPIGEPVSTAPSVATSAMLPTLLEAPVSVQSDAVVDRLNKLSERVSQVWGEDNVVLPSETQVVKYSPDMRSRSIIDLKDGKLIVETLADGKEELSCHQALVQALLTPEDPRRVDVLSTEPNVITEKPFLLGQLVDSLGKPIDSLARANKFAAWAVVNRSQWIALPKSGRVQRVSLALDANHKQVRAARFAPFIEAEAAKYNLDVNLLYAITETESHFNPFAVSKTGALGLMQLVATKAGRDAMKASTGQDRVPTIEELRDPATNVRLGAAYVARLGNHYLGGVANAQSKEFAVIAAYNGGSVRALKVFGSDKAQAVAMLNKLPPKVVYDTLKSQHSSAETRGYVEKVTTAKKRYSTRV